MPELVLFRAFAVSTFPTAQADIGKTLIPRAQGRIRQVDVIKWLVGNENVSENEGFEYFCVE
jgi:hypothetical protein